MTSLDHALVKTFRNMRHLRARRREHLEDYYHDAIVTRLEKGLALGEWLRYLSAAVYYRIRYSREGRMDLSLDYAVLCEARPVDMNTRIDIQKAMGVLTDKQYAYIYLYYYEGYVLGEIADLHNTTFQSVDCAITRGLLRMRKVLEG